MGRVGYDSLEGCLRVTAAGEAQQVAPLAVDILTYHAALEIEMDEFLKLCLPRAGKLKGLGFQHKISVVNASWKGDAKKGDKLADALVRFNELRNSVAHNDHHRLITAQLGRLITATQALDPDLPDSASPREIAVSICGFMGDDPDARKAMHYLNQLDVVVNRLLPAALSGDT